ncbi:MAG: 6-carboxytetrahydropterin synthase QueD [Polyangiales bacterium]
MYEIRQETVIAAAHQLRLSPGEGERLHGHNWRIKAVLRCDRLDSRGMVVDFNDFGREFRALVEPWEHVFLNELVPWNDINPTAENIACVVAENLGAKLDDDRVKVARVEVWENDTCGAVFYRLR